jgi:deazaflavin-dependent oxidoreductase (nitroreductase family)
MVKSLFRLFKYFMAISVFLYRLTGGKFGGKMQGLRVLLLTTTGRKTGKKRTTPLGYFEQDGGYVIIASNAGFDTHPAWFHNLRSNPRAAIQVNDRQFEVSAEIAGVQKRGQLWERLMELSPSYANYAKRTRREIPLVILRPVQA